MIERPRLYRALDRWREARAVVIRAPAGFGKSSLVSRWLDVAGLVERSAWVTLDEGDADPSQFVHYIAAALDALRPGALDLVRPILEDRQGNAGRALARLLSAFDDLAPADAAASPVLLVLDDLHRVRAPEIDALALKMIEHGPDSLHLILITRSRPDVSLARLFAHEKIAELTADDLRFTQDETAAYLLGHGFADAQDAVVAQVAQRSDGWITALQLGVLSLRHPGNIDELLGALRGDREWLAEFLTDEVLERQTPELRRFLLHTAILDAFNAPLCAAVTGEAATHGSLTALVRADLFLIRLDHEDGWFRYHHLFRELLQHRLRAQVKPALVAGLHRRAAAWLDGAGRVHEAVHHWLAAGEEDRAAALVEERMRGVLVRSPYDARRLLDALPERIVHGRPRLMLDRGYLAMLVDDAAGLSGMVQRVQDLLQEQHLSPQVAPALHGEWLVLRAAVAFLHVDHAAARRYLEQAAPYRAQLSDLVAGAADFVAMHLQHHAGQHADASHSAERALAAFTQAEFAVGTVAIRRELARWSMRSGHSADAARRFHELFDDWQRQRLPVTSELALAFFFAAEDSYWRDQLEQARAYQQASLSLAIQLQDDQMECMARHLDAFLGASTRTHDAAAAHLSAWAAHIKSKSMAQVLLFMEVHALIAAGRGDLASASMQHARSQASGWSARPGNLHMLAEMYTSVAEGAQLDDVAPVLDEALGKAVATEDRLTQLRLLGLKAWLQRKRRGRRAAAASLAQAAQLAASTGYARVLLDIPDMAAMLAEMNGAARALLPGVARPEAHVVRLTEAEHNVLRLLSADHTYEEIAAELLIGVNTVRTHVRHIYRKLGVHRRMQAVAAARQRGILPTGAGSRP